jgi:hypothetical protein
MAKSELELHALSQAKEHEAYFQSPCFNAEVEETKINLGSKLTSEETEIVREHELQELELTYD